MVTERLEHPWSITKICKEISLSNLFSDQRTFDGNIALKQSLSPNQYNKNAVGRVGQ